MENVDIPQHLVQDPQGRNMPGYTRDVARTPMQWSAGAHAGFTRGTPWEALQPDSATANVATEEADTRSLLRLYRRLIHLRTGNPALSRGVLARLSADGDAVAAYLRREGDRIVLVVANLGERPLPAVRLSSGEAALPPGRYEARVLLGAGAGAGLVVGADGRIHDYAPAGSLGPLEFRILEITAR
jgi:glycosidase